MTVNPNKIRFTPAQSAFLRAHIEGYTNRGWTSEDTGVAGSDRRFVRVRCVRESVRSYVLILWDSSDRDWERFIRIQQDLQPSIQLLPEVFSHDETHGLILEEDLGETTLAASCSGMSREDMRSTYQSVVDALVVWQGIPPSVSKTVSARSMDKEMFLWESEYFARHCVTEFFGCESLLDTAWEKERNRIAGQTSSFESVCIHRDFQSENILLTDGRVRFVDFQGARLGPAGYDLASLLLDPYNDSLDETLSSELLEYYHSRTPRPLLDEEFALCGLQRLMQALGAYGNLSLHKGKQRYRQYVRPALQRLTALAAEVEACDSLKSIAETCLGKLEDGG